MFQPHLIKRAILFFALLCLLAHTLNAQLRIVSYNTTPTVNAGLAEVLAAIGAENVNGIERPVDILALQEQPSHQETQAVVDILNQIYGDEIYTRGNLIGAGFFTQGVVYNTQTVQLVAEKRVGTTSFRGAPRQALRYQFRPIGYQSDSDFYIYNSHFKANDTDNDAARRAVEAATLRSDAATLGDDASIIYLGDLNLYRNNELAFERLTASGVGQAFDPVDQVGRWHTSTRYKRFHTQSTTISGGENRAGGGVDDRFDFQLVTGNMMDGQGVSYIGPNVPNTAEIPLRHSYRVFGNNGTHFTSRSISTGTGASPEILDALESASDHLPVVVDYQIPASMQVAIDAPSRMIVGADASGVISVANIANVDQSIAADELRYSIASVSSVNFSASGEVIATHSPNQHTFSLDAATIGAKNVTLVVSADELATANRLQSLSADYEVLAHANASFDQAEDTDELLIDLSEFDRGDLIPFEFDVFNLGDPNLMTSDLLIPSFSIGNEFVELNLAETQIPLGGSATFVGQVNLPEVGDIDFDLVIENSDELIPGSINHGPLRIRIVGSSVAELTGDFDRDNQLTAADIDALAEAIRFGSSDVAFDVNRDGVVDFQDKEHWVIELANSFFGDSNLDGQFDSRDLIFIFQSNEYRDALIGNSTWSSGDWDGDTEFDTSDLLLAFQQGGYENGPRPTFDVPEPIHLLGIVVFFFINALRRSDRQEINV